MTACIRPRLTASGVSILSKMLPPAQTALYERDNGLTISTGPFWSTPRTYSFLQHKTDGSSNIYCLVRRRNLLPSHILYPWGSQQRCWHYPLGLLRFVWCVVVHAITVFIAFQLGLLSSILTHRIFLHTLRMFHGPPQMKVTQFWSVYMAVTHGRNHAEFSDVHHEYGDYIRIGGSENICVNSLNES